ncbi:NAD(P)H-binding protein [Thermostichus vulcanus]|uniref:NAD(P)H-binding protein n=1 Tax=Thermostichus vulcanus str. 'Rupite' TaxID=2813851 RepID=A0ABT0C7E5_THEVL|nr:NAD(P)H-binding protein [Thermostichus vulcanus]MCJ2541716.1 NAD(P)H-binding protein [Thermostichus vulcanus str. 'Rupite']
MKVLVVGATGTLGRQVVRRAIEEGHQVTCLVRNPAKAAFLSEWGAHLKVGNLLQPSTLQAAMEGIEAVIDCATVRVTDSLSARQVDWDGKVALINAARAAQVGHFIFFSIMGAHHEYANVPLMNFKHHIEKYLIGSQMPYTIFRTAGFMQGLISQYAIPILEEQMVWVTSETVPTAYLDTWDVARFAVRALSVEAAKQQIFPLAGPKAWTAREVIALCEQLSSKKAKVSTMPLGLLRGARKVAQFFQWSWNIADRLAFAEVIAAKEPMHADMTAVYETLGMDPASVTTLEDYLAEYFQKMLKRIRDLKVKQPKVKTPF